MGGEIRLRLRRVYTLREGREDTLESWEGVNTEIWEGKYA